MATVTSVRRHAKAVVPERPVTRPCLAFPPALALSVLSYFVSSGSVRSRLELITAISHLLPHNTIRHQTYMHPSSSSQCMSPATATPQTGSCASPEKSQLFCPECWHESRVDGDWQVQVTKSGRHLDCPTCGETVTVRPPVTAKATATSLPVVAYCLAAVRLTTRFLTLGWRLCVPAVNQTGTSCSPLTAAESPDCHS